MPQFLFPPQIRLPRTPSSGASETDWIRWANALQETFKDEYRKLAQRLQDIITVDVIANRPAANGSYRFFFSTDEAPEVLYFDDGTWNPL